MLNLFDVLFVLALFAVIRYELDVKLMDAVKRRKTQKLINSLDEEELYSEGTDESPLDPYQRDYDEYDKRIARLRDEVSLYNNAPSNAEESPGVFNLPHQQVQMEIEIEPSVEEENEQGFQEIAR